jgi:uncharacterized protein (DUF433 family)
MALRSVSRAGRAVVDLRDGVEPADFAARFNVLDRHQVKAVCLVRKLGEN